MITNRELYAKIQSTIGIIDKLFHTSLFVLQDHVGDTLQYGVLGTVQHIPTGYVLETLVLASSGVHTAMLEWGDRLLARYGKERYAYKRDYILTHLGYSTVCTLLTRQRYIYIYIYVCVCVCVCVKSRNS